MKTTVDLPEALLHEAKVVAAQRRTSLKSLVEQGLQFVLHGNPGPREESSFYDEDSFFESDEYDIPVLKSRGVTVTEDWINGIRTKENI